MCQIRPATHDDLDALLAMGEKFFSFSRFAQFAIFDRDTARASITALIDAEVGVCLVAVIDGEVIGGIVGALSPLWFAPTCLSATEFAWWVSEEHRGGMAGVKLLRSFEQWAKDKGAAMVSLSDLIINGETPAGRLLENLGYLAIERSHVKRVN